MVTGVGFGWGVAVCCGVAVGWGVVVGIDAKAVATLWSAMRLMSPSELAHP